MWMAERPAAPLAEPAAELGQVTLDGGAGVALAGERRGVPVCAPGGYRWTPARGDTVLVVKTGPEAAPCVAGQLQPEGEPGEVYISVADGAGIRLRPDGTVAITGRVTINGEEV